MGPLHQQSSARADHDGGGHNHHLERHGVTDQFRDSGSEYEPGDQRRPGVDGGHDDEADGHQGQRDDEHRGRDGHWKVTPRP